ncbi:MAG: ATPase domain-containing protein [Minicystis sp.]
MLAHLRRMSYFDPALVGSRVFYLSAFQILEGAGLEALQRMLREAISAHKASFVVLDGFASAEESTGSAKDLKKFIHELQSVTSMLGCTVLLLCSTERTMSFRPEYTVVDGIIELGDDLHELRPIRHLRARKMRGVNQVRGQHTFEITDAGVRVIPRVETRVRKGPDEPEVTPAGERHPFGIPRLDEMLGGGLPGNSMTMLLGSSGCGRSTLCLHYLAEGARRGEPGVYFGFYERPPSILRKSRRFGLGIEEHVKKNLIELVWQAPIELVVDKLADRLLAAVKRLGARRLVIDGIDGFALALDEYPTRLRSVLSAVSEELEREGVTAVYTVETRELFGPAIEVPVNGISAITQNILFLRHLELRSKMMRLISILKMRDSGYDPTVRELAITDTGVVVGEAFEGVDQILPSTALRPVGLEKERSGAENDASPADGRRTGRRRVS